MSVALARMAATPGNAAGSALSRARAEFVKSDVVAIWRDTKGWTHSDLERDKQFVLERKLTEGADEVFVNGDSFIPEAKALDPVFKRLMFSKVQT